jgi:hypothetical protein
MLGSSGVPVMRALCSYFWNHKDHAASEGSSDMSGYSSWSHCSDQVSKAWSLAAQRSCNPHLPTMNSFMHKPVRMDSVDCSKDPRCVCGVGLYENKP